MDKRPKEHTLYDGLIKGALAEGWLLTRISDQSYGKKVADIIGCAPNGIGALVEVKVVSHLPLEYDFPWQIFETHQINWLNGYVRAHAYALAPLFCWPSDTMRVYRIKEEPPYPWYDLTERRDGFYVGWNQILERRSTKTESQ